MASEPSAARRRPRGTQSSSRRSRPEPQAHVSAGGGLQAMAREGPACWRMAQSQTPDRGQQQAARQKWSSGGTHTGPAALLTTVACVVLGLALVCQPSVAQPATPDLRTLDLNTLLEVKASMEQWQNTWYGQNPIEMLSTWDATSDPCAPESPWFGVECTPPNDNTRPRVISLNLEMSRLTGPIPTAIARLNVLTQLKLDLNKFNGTIPEELSALTSLQELDLEFNRLSGPLPTFISLFKDLKLLKASSNLLNGTLPVELSAMSSLTYLDLSSNQFSGAIPDISQLERLEHLLLSANKLTGNVPDWLDEMFALSEVSLRKNQLSGSIPNFTNALSLEHMFLGYNNLTGPLPATIGSLTGLSTLFLPGNQLEGGIPLSFSNMSSLNLLDLSSNPKLGGTIPDFLGALDGLSLLQLTGCSFTGTIPDTLSYLTNLKELYLDGNELTGAVPPGLSNLTAVTQLYLSDNQLSGPIPGDLCALEDIMNLDLSNNQLAGALPQCLVDLPTLRFLSVSDNLLTGTVPQPANPDLRFQYSGNCFPSEAEQKTDCVAGSGKTGGDPTPEAGDQSGGDGSSQNGSDTGSGSDQTASGSSSAGGTVPIQYPASTAANSSSSGGGFPLWASIILVVFAFVFLAFMAYTFSYSITSIAASVVNRPDQLPVQEFSLSKIKKATKSFSTVYGRGSFGTVYLAEDFRKGHPEPRVIVKRAADPQKLGEFLFKCKVEVLARARHRYLVNLLGYCTGKGERILVYEYLPNGTLFDRLHRPELEPLPWDVRVRIAVSIACALEHLHHGLTPPLVHRAVTSSNILLAADMTAKLSDFGIARGSLGTAGSFDDTPRRRSKARGGPGGRGSGAEPTAQGILQLEKVDVYGFGVVLLELITGQKAMKEVHITSVAAPFLEDPQMMPLMVDPQLGGYFNQDELIQLATIARDCARDDPMARPSMRDVLQCMEDKLRLDANLFENTDVGDDMLTDNYTPGGGGSTAPTLANPPHVRQSSSSSSLPIWQAVESFAMSVRGVLSPGGRFQPLGSQTNQEDFEMSSLLVVGGSATDTGRLPR